MVERSRSAIARGKKAMERGNKEMKMWATPWKLSRVWRLAFGRAWEGPAMAAPELATQQRFYRT